MNKIFNIIIKVFNTFSENKKYKNDFVKYLNEQIKVIIKPFSIIGMLVWIDFA